MLDKDLTKAEFNLNNPAIPALEGAGSCWHCRGRGCEQCTPGPRRFNGQEPSLPFVVSYYSSGGRRSEREALDYVMEKFPEYRPQLADYLKQHPHLKETFSVSIVITFNSKTGKEDIELHKREQRVLREAQAIVELAGRYPALADCFEDVQCGDLVEAPRIVRFVDLAGLVEKLCGEEAADAPAD